MKDLPESDEPIAHTHIQFAHCYKRQAGWSKLLARFAGAAVGALALGALRNGPRLRALEPFEKETSMVNSVKKSMGGSGKGVKALVIGALGRCGRGAVDLLRKIGLEE